MALGQLIENSRLVLPESWQTLRVQSVDETHSNALIWNVRDEREGQTGRSPSLLMLAWELKRRQGRWVKTSGLFPVFRERLRRQGNASGARRRPVGRWPDTSCGASDRGVVSSLRPSRTGCIPASGVRSTGRSRPQRFHSRLGAIARQAELRMRNFSSSSSAIRQNRPH
jgi:hypothetical protein